MSQNKKIEKPEVTINIKKEGCFSGCGKQTEGCLAVMVIGMILALPIALVDKACNCGIMDETAESRAIVGDWKDKQFRLW